MAISTRFRSEQLRVTEFPYSNILQVKLPIRPLNHLPPRKTILMKFGVNSTVVKISQTAKFSIRQLVDVFMDCCLTMIITAQNNLTTRSEKILERLPLRDNMRVPNV